MTPTFKSRPPGIGVARYVVEQMIGGPTRSQESYPLVHQLTVVTLVPNNPDRVELVISNITQGNIIVGTVASSVATGQGILIPAQGGFMSVFIADDYTLPTNEWFALGTVTNDGFPVYALEIISDVIVEGQ